MKSCGAGGLGDGIKNCTSLENLKFEIAMYYIYHKINNY